MIDELNTTFKLKLISYTLKKIKELLIFNKIYEYSQGKDAEERFDNALYELNTIKYSYIDTLGIELIFKDLESIFAKLKEELSNQDSKIDKLIKQMIYFFI